LFFHQSINPREKPVLKTFGWNFFAALPASKKFKNFGHPRPTRWG